MTPAQAAASGSIFSFDPTGLKVPASFSESPIWAAQVAAGTLPAVDKRIPRKPFVHRTVDQIGEYGGTWRRAFTGPADGQNYDRMNHDQFFMWDVNGVEWFPYMADSIDIEDETVYTIFLREGIRWSDGNELDADDWVFGIEDLVYNEEMNPGRNKKLGYSTFAPTFEKIDNYTIRFSFDEPMPSFTDGINGCCGPFGGWTLHGRTGMPTFAPRQYLEQFHPDYAAGGAAGLQALAEENGFENWMSQFKDLGNPNYHTEVPSAAPWQTTNSQRSELWELTRNPYFFSVDTAGNQLPYIDKISMELVDDIEILNLKGIAGEFDFQARHIVLGKLPVYFQNEDRGGYHMVVKRGTSFHEGMTANQTWEGDAELAKWAQNRDFRTAVSLSLNREEVKEVLNLGMGDTGWAVPPKGHPWFMDNEFTESYNALPRQVDKANALLDAIGLTEKDSSGYRLRTDGSGKRLSFDCITIIPYFTDTEGFLELVESHTADIGLEFKPKPIARTTYSASLSDNQMLWGCLGGGNVSMGPLPSAPISGGYNAGTLYGDWYASDGKSGTDPAGTDFERLYNLYQASLKLAKADRKDILQEAWGIHMTNMWGFNTVKNAPSFNDVVIVKNNIKNLVEDSQDFNQWPGEIHLDQMFFVGGKNDKGF